MESANLKKEDIKVGLPFRWTKEGENGWSCLCVISKLIGDDSFKIIFLDTLKERFDALAFSNDVLKHMWHCTEQEKNEISEKLKNNRSTIKRSFLESKLRYKEDIQNAKITAEEAAKKIFTRASQKAKKDLSERDHQQRRLLLALEMVEKNISLHKK